MKSVGDGDVHEVDEWICEEILVGPVRLLEVVFVSVTLSGGGVSGGNCVEDDTIVCLYRVNN